jgi:hypothetical protein
VVIGSVVWDLLILQHREPVRRHPAQIGTVDQLAQGGSYYKELKTD